MVYRTEDLKMMHSETLDVSPAILIPYYDEDSNTLFLTGKVRLSKCAFFPRGDTYSRYQQLNL